MMKIIKQRGEDSQGWYYADSGDRRVSPVFEHEGVLDTWAELHGAFTAFIVFKKNLASGEEECLGPYNDYETADRSRMIEGASNHDPGIFIGVRKEKWMPGDEVGSESKGLIIP